jgi:hypothetical protein
MSELIFVQGKISMTTIDNIMTLADSYAAVSAVSTMAHAVEVRAVLVTALMEALAKDISLVDEGDIAQPVREPFTSDQLMALTLCHEDKRVSVSKVQRILQISYKEAQELCQSIIDAGQCEGFEIAPNLHRIGSDK